MMQLLINFLQLIRWKNIFIFLLFQLIVYIKFHANVDVVDYINYNIILILFASAGNIQNDLYDIEVDRINKKSKNTYLVTHYYKILRCISTLLYLLGMILTYVLFYQSNSQLFGFLVLIPILLTIYNIHLKRVALLGNLVVSFSIAFVLFLTLNFFFRWQPIFNFYIAISFLLHLVREIVKDIEDVNGDRQANYYTLPVLSMFITNLAVKILVVAFWILIYNYFEYFEESQKIVLGVISLCLIDVIININNEQYTTASRLLKSVMVIGILTILM